MTLKQFQDSKVQQNQPSQPVTKTKNNHSMTANMTQRADQTSLNSDGMNNPQHRNQLSERVINNSSSKGGGMPNQMQQSLPQQSYGGNQ
jgi:hypothetical protein